MYCKNFGTENVTQAKFCKGCGATIILESTVVSVNQKQAPKQTERKILLIGGILLLLAVLILSWFLFIKPYLEDKNAARFYSIANDAVLRKSPVAGVDYEIITAVPYGAEVLVYKNEGDFYRCKVDGKKGYIAQKLLLEKQDFITLNSVFGDAESKQVIETVKCRKAVLNYFKEHNYLGKLDDNLQVGTFGSLQSSKEAWQIFAKGKDAKGNLIKPNNVLFPKLNEQNKFTAFAVIIKNVSSNMRKTIVFTFDENENASIIEERIAPVEGYIENIFYHDGVLFIKYTTAIDMGEGC